MSLSGKQAEAVALLVAGESQESTAQAVGVARETVNRWVNGDQAFKDELGRLRADLWEECRDRLVWLSSKALDVLAELMDSGSDSVRFRVASHVLKIAEAPQSYRERHKFDFLAEVPFPVE